ncbi:MAG: hypothetical protein N3A56_08370, partial [Thermodesulfobacteriaceae bacterium]|nr:hypothetical protein [Thermodesulfobacteriaceae bacterium]
MQFLKSNQEKLLFLRIDFIFFYFLLNLGFLFSLNYLMISVTLKFTLILLVILLFSLLFFVYKNKNYFLALAGYLWMGNIIFFYTVFFLFLFFTKLFSLSNLSANIALSISFSSVITFITFLRKDKINIKTYNIISEKLKGLKKPVKLVFFCDLHWGLIIRNEEVNRIIEKINNID